MKNFRKSFRIALFFAGILHVTFSVSAQSSEDGGKDLFLKNCASCHGKDGKAKTPMGHKLRVKDLTQSKTTDAEIAKQVTEGSVDEDNNQMMPPFKDKLSPEEIKSLAEYIKTLRK